MSFLPFSSKKDISSEELHRLLERNQEIGEWLIPLVVVFGIMGFALAGLRIMLFFGVL